MGNCKSSHLQVSGNINNKIVTYTPEDNVVFVTYADFRTWSLQKFYKLQRNYHYMFSIKAMHIYDKMWKDVGVSEEIGRPDFIRLYQMNGIYYDFKFHYPNDY
jgi:hypothetical protein